MGAMSVRMDPTVRAPRTAPEALARYFRVLGDPTRIKILECLLGGERTVGELVAVVGAPQSRVSNHLACLRWCRFVGSERRGRQVIYRIADPSIAALLKGSHGFVSRNAEHLSSCRRIGPEWI